MLSYGNRGVGPSGLIAAGSMVCAALVCGSSRADAATITVNGSCSLAQAVTAVNNRAATGGCPAGTGSDTIVLRTGSTTDVSALTITRSVTIRSSTAKWKATLKPFDGTSPSAMFTIAPPAGTAASVTFQDVEMFDSNFNTTAIRAIGRNSSDKVTLTRCTFSSFQTSAVYASNMSVSVSDSYFLLNSGGAGGAIRVEGSSSSTVLTLATSSFEGNISTSAGGAVYYSGGAAHSTLKNCTFNKNSATYGGGLALYGPGIFDIIGSTIANNFASLEGGGGTSTATVNFTLTLLAANYIDPNPDLSSDWDFNSTINRLDDSLLADTFSHDGFGNYRGIPLNSLGANSIIDHESSFGAIVSSDSFNLGGDIMDAPPTLRLPDTSPAIDAIPSNVTSLTTDQRGCARGIDFPNSVNSNRFDIGAVEADPNIQAETLFATSTVNGTLSMVSGISGFQPSTGGGIKFVPGSSGASSVSFHLPMANGGGAQSIVLHVQSCPNCGTYQISVGDDLLPPVQFVSLGTQSFSSSTIKTVTLPALSLAPFEDDGLGEDDVIDIKFTLVSKPANSNGQMVLDFISLLK